MTARSVVARALVFGGIVVAAVAVVGALVGALVAGLPGLASALVAAALTAVFLGLTAASILGAQAATRTRPSLGVYFGIILGVWAVKFVLFVVALLALRSAEWMNPVVFFFAMVAAVLGSLAADVVALTGARVEPVPAPPLPDLPPAGNPGA